MAHWFNGFGFSPVLQIVLTASCQASLLAVIILVSQSMMGRWLSPRWRYALWAVVLIRLMMPIAPGSTLSVFNLFRIDPVSTVIVVPQTVVLTADVIIYSRNIPVPSITAPPPATTMGMDDIALAIWLVGIATLLSIIAAINIALAFRLRHRSATTDPDLLELLESCKREMGVRRKVLLYDDPKIASPALAGIFRPSLLIPPDLLADMPREELRFILLHELAHLKKHDIAQNWLLIVLASVHWFNPIIWLAFARLRADRELARDAMVLQIAGTHASQAYGQTIIHTLERITHPRLNNPALAGIGDGMGQLKRRLRMIALAPKRRPALTLVGITLLATLAVIGLTDAAEPESPPTDTEHAEVSAEQPGGIQILFESRILLVPDKLSRELGIGHGMIHLSKNTQARFLDDIEANLILHAVKKDPSVVTLAAPTVLQLDGQRAKVLVGQNVGFVAGYERVEGAEGIDYLPLIETIAEGFMLKTEGAVNEDRRSITMTITPTVTNLRRPFGKHLWADSLPGENLFVEVPHIWKTESEVTVTIPDQGTLLIDLGTVSGPMNDHDPVEEGVERRVYMLVKPTIIMPDG